MQTYLDSDDLVGGLVHGLIDLAETAVAQLLLNLVHVARVPYLRDFAVDRCLARINYCLSRLLFLLSARFRHGCLLVGSSSVLGQLGLRLLRLLRLLRGRVRHGRVRRVHRRRCLALRLLRSQRCHSEASTVYLLIATG